MKKSSFVISLDLGSNITTGCFSKRDSNNEPADLLIQGQSRIITSVHIESYIASTDQVRGKVAFQADEAKFRDQRTNAYCSLFKLCFGLPRGSQEKVHLDFVDTKFDSKDRPCHEYMGHMVPIDSIVRFYLERVLSSSLVYLSKDVKKNRNKSNPFEECDIAITYPSTWSEPRVHHYANLVKKIGFANVFTYSEPLATCKYYSVKSSSIYKHDSHHMGVVVDIGGTNGQYSVFSKRDNEAAKLYANMGFYEPSGHSQNMVVMKNLLAKYVDPSTQKPYYKSFIELRNSRGDSLANKLLHECKIIKEEICSQADGPFEIAIPEPSSDYSSDNEEQDSNEPLVTMVTLDKDWIVKQWEKDAVSIHSTILKLVKEHKEENSYDASAKVYIFLTGGAFMNPFMRQRLEELLGPDTNSSIDCTILYEESSKVVARGAMMLAREITNCADQQSMPLAKEYRIKQEDMQTPESLPLNFSLCTVALDLKKRRHYDHIFSPQSRYPSKDATLVELNVNKSNASSGYLEIELIQQMTNKNKFHLGMHSIALPQTAKPGDRLRAYFSLDKKRNIHCKYSIHSVKHPGPLGKGSFVLHFNNEKTRKVCTKEFNPLNPLHDKAILVHFMGYKYVYDSDGDSEDASNENDTLGKHRQEEEEDDDKRPMRLTSKVASIKTRSNGRAKHQTRAITASPNEHKPKSTTRKQKRLEREEDEEDEPVKRPTKKTKLQ